MSTKDTDQNLHTNKYSNYYKKEHTKYTGVYESMSERIYGQTTSNERWYQAYQQ